MKTGVRALPRLFDLVDGAEMTPDMVTRLAALAIMQAHIVADELHEIVIPLLPPARRTHAASIARRIERGEFLEEDVLSDVQTFNANLAQQIALGTHVYWQGDDNHVRGGYEAVYREPEACELAEVAGELALLADMILATLSAARAVRETATLIDG
ncbi:hypothetical protein [Pseudoroseicyclus tamaricis]|uniref:Uncharacterized protein n=1 Tax=Pseudoroseicyclus tamaricis TaxID=2705421 RepID=A0A6B2JUN1_9RHOB|nr:hypothetical protein [Pseudoroseicyclus tamaricis]NDU99883.1 hypothetical protein [Pseudoroseicyclus tamaricis]